MSKKYRTDAMAAIHETMEALHDVGAVEKQTMRRFDDACLTPVRLLKPEEIKAIREKEHVSQTVFANYLNVTSSLVSKWERGEKRPSGASLKLLSLVEKNGLATVASCRNLRFRSPGRSALARLPLARESSSKRRAGIPGRTTQMQGSAMARRCQPRAIGRQIIRCR
jgi:putative transcriptional regulator